MKGEFIVNWDAIFVGASFITMHWWVYRFHFAVFLISISFLYLQAIPYFSKPNLTRLYSALFDAIPPAVLYLYSRNGTITRDIKLPYKEELNKCAIWKTWYFSWRPHEPYRTELGTKCWIERQLEIWKTIFDLVCQYLLRLVFFICKGICSKRPFCLDLIFDNYLN